MSGGSLRDAFTAVRAEPDSKGAKPKVGPRDSKRDNPPQSTFGAAVA
jgi:hypothetical protein